MTTHFENPNLIKESIFDVAIDNLSVGLEPNKKMLSHELNILLDPFREKRVYYEAHRNEVISIIQEGSEKANKIGNETVETVKNAMSIQLI